MYTCLCVLVYCLNEIILLGMIILLPRAIDYLTKFLVTGMRNLLYSC